MIYLVYREAKVSHLRNHVVFEEANSAAAAVRAANKHLEFSLSGGCYKRDYKIAQAKPVEIGKPFYL